MNCQAWGVQNETGKLLPTLHDVRLTSLDGTVAVYEGILRVRLRDGTFSTFYQQWRVEALGLQPPSSEVAPQLPELDRR